MLRLYSIATIRNRYLFFFLLINHKNLWNVNTQKKEEIVSILFILFFNLNQKKRRRKLLDDRGSWTFLPACRSTTTCHKTNNFFGRIWQAGLIFTYQSTEEKIVLFIVKFSKFFGFKLWGGDHQGSTDWKISKKKGKNIYITPRNIS